MNWDIYSDMCLLKQTMSRICIACSKTFQQVTDDRCMFCGHQAQNMKCLQCVQWKRTIKHTALYQYNDAMKEYFKAYKLWGGYHLKDVFKAELLKEIKRMKHPLIVPIPSTQEANEARGFDQVRTLLTGIPYKPLLICTNKKKQHQKNLNLKQRLESNQLFELNNSCSLPTKDTKICLFDDIYTTGQTIFHAAECLKSQGFTDIVSMSIAR
ncbi:ComF family protein [Weissella ceti]|uniref:ComF family protein n=1 Tax=Weissella ceti TaxID=759620 RepID=UPI001BCBE140|nr:ComF family protein [Weissella ceti]QVK12223.1 ComF family protein [Weissella ceti]